MTYSHGHRPWDSASTGLPEDPVGCSQSYVPPQWTMPCPSMYLWRLCQSCEPGLPDVDGCVYITVQMGTTLGAVPYPLLRAEMEDPAAAEAAGLCRRLPAADLDHADALCAGDVLQDSDKLSKSQVRDFTAPQVLHTVQVEVLDADDGEFVGQLVSQFEEPVAPAVTNLLVHPVQVPAGAFPVVAALLTPGKLPVSSTKL